MNLGMSMVGGVLGVKLLSSYGRDKLFPKGLFLGIAFGSVITGILSGFSNNKVRPKDAVSNLSYLLSHAAFGLVSIFTIAKIGDDSLFDTPPQNDHLKPTMKTTEQRKESKNNKIQHGYPDNDNLENVLQVDS
ncbi:hypothetical protein [Desulfosporosinus fructosivorans]|uniref:hypothetical protein n=1 Tax=Desulfosporosinus fructosivorans TaxID=2018669 RepID=UPI001A7EE6B4|nr:hypothetical protein [Desulfosporosinus fructosivorans]